MTDAQNTTTINPTTKTLFDLGAHLGHKKNRLHPKSRRYLYKIINGVSIIDLTITTEQLEKAKKVLNTAAKENKNILVVATKKIAAQYTAEICKNNSIAHITTKWLPGLLTNFDTIMKNVNKLKKMHEEKQSGGWDKFVKHERYQLDKVMIRLEKFYGGLIYLDKKPDLLVVVDIKKEKNSISEGKLYDIPVVALTDTNTNPDQVSYPIVINDDSAEVVHHVIKELVEAYIKGKK